MLFARLLKPLIRTGRITLIDAHGKRWEFGGESGPADERPCTVRLTDPSLHWKLGVNPGLHAGEAYMAGTLVVEEGSIYDLLSIVTRNAGDNHLGPVGKLRRFGVGLQRLWQQANPADRSRRNVAHHYDLSEKLYDLFLDKDRQYSCAYFADPGMSLDQAQAAKKRHIIAKLLLKPGLKVLDIGCGWGGLALEIAKSADVQVKGITLSQEQLAIARRRAREAGLEHRVQFELQDYRAESGTYDRIVSVGMFEHVGVPQYGAFFRKIDELLDPDGVALLHSIGRTDGPGTTNPWLRKYIFPGGYSPALSEVIPHVERSGLMPTDMEFLRLHYAETLRQWRQRVAANRDRLVALYDERFYRMWEFYLAGCECAFRHQGHMVWQLQMAKRADAVPLTRDYIYEAEHRMAVAAE